MSDFVKFCQDSSKPTQLLFHILYSRWSNLQWMISNSASTLMSCDHSWKIKELVIVNYWYFQTFSWCWPLSPPASWGPCPPPWWGPCPLAWGPCPLAPCRWPAWYREQLSTVQLSTPRKLRRKKRHQPWAIFWKKLSWNYSEETARFPQIAWFGTFWPRTSRFSSRLWRIMLLFQRKVLVFPQEYK